MKTGLKSCFIRAWNWCWVCYSHTWCLLQQLQTLM